MSRRKNKDDQFEPIPEKHQEQTENSNGTFFISLFILIYDYTFTVIMSVFFLRIFPFVSFIDFLIIYSFLFVINQCTIYFINKFPILFTKIYSGIDQFFCYFFDLGVFTCLLLINIFCLKQKSIINLLLNSDSLFTTFCLWFSITNLVLFTGLLIYFISVGIFVINNFDTNSLKIFNKQLQEKLDKLLVLFVTQSTLFLFQIEDTPLLFYLINLLMLYFFIFIFIPYLILNYQKLKKISVDYFYFTSFYRTTCIFFICNILFYEYLIYKNNTSKKLVLYLFDRDLYS